MIPKESLKEGRDHRGHKNLPAFIPQVCSVGEFSVLIPNNILQSDLMMMM